MKPKLTEHSDVSLMAEFDPALICRLSNLLQISAGFNSHLQEEIERRLTYVASDRNLSGLHKSSAH